MSGAEETTTPTVEGEAPDTNVNVEATSSESSVNMAASAEDLPGDEAAPETADEQAPAPDEEGAESAAPSEEATLVTVGPYCCNGTFAFYRGGGYYAGHFRRLEQALSVLEECISYGDIPADQRERLTNELNKVFAEAEQKRKVEETEENFARSRRILEQAQEDAGEIVRQAANESRAIVNEAKEVLKDAAEKAKKLEVQVKVDRVSVSTYGSGERTVSFDGVSFTLPTSSFVSLLAGEQAEPEYEDVELGGMPMSPRGMPQSGTGDPFLDALLGAFSGMPPRRPRGF